MNSQERRGSKSISQSMYNKFVDSPTYNEYIHTFQNVSINSSDDEENVDLDQSRYSLYDEKNESELFKEYKKTIYPWDPLRLKEHPLTDKKKNRLRRFKLNKDEKNGILSERMVACCLTHLQRSPYDLKYALCNCRLNEKNLVDISLLRRYHYIQYLDVSSNKLTTLAALNEMPYLQYLDASYNQLEVLLDFKAPFFLSYVNYSHNKLEEIPDLSKFWSIYHLDLSYNEISKIHGLADLRYLTYLNLSFNYVSIVENLDNLKIDTLIMTNNQLIFVESYTSISGFATLNYIRSIDFSSNYLTSLKFLEKNMYLEAVNLENNNIEDLIQLCYLRNHQYLFNLNLRNNKISRINHFTRTCIRMIKNLNILNQKDLSAEEKVEAYTKSSINPVLPAATSQIKLMLLECINMPSVGPHVQSVDKQNHKILIIVGLPSSKHRYIVHRLIEECKDQLVLGKVHTTVPGPGDGSYCNDCNFVKHDTFVELMRKGEFVAFSEFNGYLIGLSYKELWKATCDTVIVFFTQIHLALTMRTTGLNVTLVLALPLDEKTHLNWLKEHYLIKEGINYNESEFRIQHVTDSCYSLYHKYPKSTDSIYLDRSMYDKQVAATLDDYKDQSYDVFGSKIVANDSVQENIKSSKCVILETKSSSSSSTIIDDSDSIKEEIAQFHKLREDERASYRNKFFQKNAICQCDLLDRELIAPSCDRLAGEKVSTTIDKNITFSSSPNMSNAEKIQITRDIMDLPNNDIDKNDAELIQNHYCDCLEDFSSDIIDINQCIEHHLMHRIIINVNEQGVFLEERELLVDEDQEELKQRFSGDCISKEKLVNFDYNLNNEAAKYVSKTKAKRGIINKSGTDATGTDRVEDNTNKLSDETANDLETDRKIDSQVSNLEKNVAERNSKIRFSCEPKTLIANTESESTNIRNKYRMESYLGINTTKVINDTKIKSNLKKTISDSAEHESPNINTKQKINIDTSSNSYDFDNSSDNLLPTSMLHNTQHRFTPKYSDSNSISSKDQYPSVLQSSQNDFVSLGFDNFPSVEYFEREPTIRKSISTYSIIKDVQEHFGMIPLLSVLSTEELLSEKTKYSTVVDRIDQTINEKLESFLKSTMQERQCLLNLHWDNPGLFQTLIFTDNESQSLTVLKEIVCNIIDNDDTRKSTEQTDEDIKRSEIVLKRLEKLKLPQIDEYNNEY